MITQLEIDPDVKAVASFMQEQLTADRLVAVAEALAGLAPVLWGHFQRSEVRALSLRAEAPISSGQRKRAASR
jgi:hypothetical protein